MNDIWPTNSLSTSSLSSGRRAYISRTLLSSSLSLAMTVPVTVTCSLANTASPTNLPVIHAAPAFNHSGRAFNHAGPSSFSSSGASYSGPAHKGLVPTWHLGNSTLQALVNQTPGAHDIDLNSAAALFAAGSLAGFHTITLDIGGKRQQIDFGSKLTGAELVAAQQVLSGGKQDLVINARGIATGGLFDLSSTSVTQLDSAAGGSIASLYVSHGVKAIDSLSNLTLLGSLVNMGSIVVAAEPSANGQVTDVISAANIYNGVGGSILSSSILGSLLPAGLTLTTPGLFYNSGSISSSGALTIAASSINNSSTVTGGGHAVAQLSAAQNVNLTTTSLINAGLISSAKGDVNITGANAGGLDVNSTGGSVQALKGNINFNDSSYKGSGNINVSGGNWLSQQLNFNAGTGAINADVGAVTGVVNGTAASSHITAATGNLQLGNIDVTGDPTYFNTAGDITITGDLVGDPDLAIVASGNIIANSGSLVTKSTTGDGGTLTLIAGANISGTGGGGMGSGTASGPPGDTTNTITVSNNSKSAGNGSASGGYIDLSGTFLTGSKTNTAIKSIDTSSTVGAGGNILMVAYQGTAKNSGSIVASAVAGAATGATVINATGTKANGSVTLIAGGTSLNSGIFAQGINGGAVNIWTGTPTITGGLTPGTIVITKGTIGGVSGSYLVPASPSLASVTLKGDVNAGTVDIHTAGEVTCGAIVTAGSGGIAGGKGSDGGSVTINGAGVFVTTIDASGGGGGGGNPGLNAGAGGAGGAGGVVTLKALGDNIQLTGAPGVAGYINVSGGGGGGGAGAGDAGAADVGGAGGTAGSVTINTPFSFVTAGPVKAFDGGSGNNGGIGVAGTSAGGGGGGGGSYGGGGGGGAAGTMAAGTGFAVGGGGGAGFFGGGGGGGTTTSGTATGGGGGSAAGLTTPTPGIAGTSSTPGGAGAIAGTNGNGGAGGNSSGGILGGGSGGLIAAGGSGGQNTGGSGYGVNGGKATIAAGHGAVSLTVGDITGGGKSIAPIEIDSAALTVTSTSKTASVFLTSASSVLNLTGATMFAGTALSLSDTGGSINISGPMTGTTINLSAAGDITTSGGGVINATTANLSSNGGNVIVSTSASNVAASALGPGGTVAITANKTGAGAINLLASTVDSGGVGGSFTVTSPQTINVTGPLSAVNGTISLIETGSTAPVGISIAASPNLGATGTLNLTVTGGGSIFDAKAITAPKLNINSDGAIGTSAKPLLTDVLTKLTVTGQSATPVFIKDSNAVGFTLTGSGHASQNITLISAAQNLVLGNLLYSNITLQDTYSTKGQTAVVSIDAANIAGSQVGNGTGVVSITTANASIEEGNSTFGIVGTNVILTSGGGNVGTVALTVTSPNITANALKGSVDIVDTVQTVLNKGTALQSYAVTGSGLTVAGAIAAAKINLSSSAGQALILTAPIGTSKSTSVTIAGDSVVQGKGSLISGVNVTFNTGASGTIGSAALPVLTKATGTLIINGGNGAKAFVSQSGAVALGASSAGGAGSLSLVDSSTINVNGNVSFDTISITAPALTVAAGITLSATTATTITSAAALAISGAGTIALGGSLTLGGTVNGKETTSITLGDAKTGSGNPLFVVLNSGASGLSALNVTTAGNLTSSLLTIATDSTGAAGAINIKAGNIVAVGNTSNSPIVIEANANFPSTLAGGSVTLTLTGSQAVTLDSKAGPAKTSAPFEVLANAGSTGGVAGSVSVSAAGNLTVNTGGFSVGGVSNTGGAVALSGGKNLLVTADLLNSSLGYSSISLNSGSSKAFTVNGGAPTVNGTSGTIGAASVSISNNTGVLIVTGTDDSITATKGLILNAKSGITLGDAKNGGINNPLKSMGNGSTLTTLMISTGGSFTDNIAGNSLALNSTGAGGVLSLTAGDVVNLNSSSKFAPISLLANSNAGPAGSVTLNITGTQAVTLGNITVTKGTPEFLITANGGSGSGNVNVKAGGALTVSSGSVTLGGGANTLTLSGGKALAVIDANLLTTNLGSLTLTSGATAPFVIGVTGPVINGTASGLSAGSVSVTELKGITVNAGFNIASVSAGQGVTFDTASFVNNGMVTGAAGSTLVFFDAGKNNLGIGGGNGTYLGFGTATFSTAGNVNVGNLLNATAPFDSALLTVSILSGGGLTFGPTAAGVTVAPSGSISISAASIASGSTTPITFGDGGSGASTVTVVDKAALTVGSSKGNIALHVAASGSTVNLTSTTGTVTVSSLIAFGKGTLTGSSLVFKQGVSAVTSLTALANGKSGTITETTGASLAVTGAGGTLALGQGATALAKTALNVNADNVVVGGANAGGALNISNSDSSTANLSSATPVAALTYVSAAPATVNLGNITTTAGGLSVTSGGVLTTGSGTNLQTTGGGITLAVAPSGSSLTIGANNTLTTSAGSIVLQNNNSTSGSITIGSGVNIHASGTAKGVGQVSIVIGAVPTTGLVVGTTPGPVAPTISTSGGAGVFYGTTAASTITANGANTLNAFGRNVVFNTGGLFPTAITINGGTITADPPEVSAPGHSAAAANLVGLFSAAVGPGPAVVASSTVSAYSTISASSIVSASSNVSASAARSGGSGPFVNNVDSTIQTIGRPKTLVGKISNTDFRTQTPIQTQALKRGPLLISPHIPTLVETEFGSVSVAPGAVALIIAFDGGVAIYNLHDSHKGAVLLECGGAKFALSPSQNVVLTSRPVRCFEEINPSPSVAYRHVTAAEHGGGMRSFQSEFNILSLLQGVAPLHRLIDSRNPDNHKIGGSILKTAAILMSIGAAEPFEYMVPRPVTAMSVRSGALSHD